MIKRPRLFADWRFMVTLAFLLMVSYLVLTGVSAIQERNELARQSADKSAQIDRLITSNQRANVAASRERQTLLHRIDSYDARQRALLAYLRAHGVKIPTRFIEAPAAPGGTGTHHHSQPSGRGGGGPLFTPQPPPSIAAPGNSAGHRHHSKKPHRLNRHAQ